MRIAIWHNLPSGGGLRALDDQLRGLAGRGHELHVWAPPSASRPPSIDVATTHREVPLTLPADERIGLRGLRSAWRGRREGLDALAGHASRCAREISDVRPDLVLAHPCQFVRVPAIGHYLDTPSVLYLQEPNRRLYEATSGSPWAAHRVTRTLRPSSLRKFATELIRTELTRVQVATETAWINGFDEVLVNSSFTRESVLRAYGRCSHVCSLGIDDERFEFQDRPAHVRGNVLSVGALVPEKNVVFLVRAVAAAGPSVRRFTWVANYVDSPYLKVVEQAAANAGILLDLRTAVTDHELLESCAEADLFVYAPRLEPFGLAPLEANATGLPVIAVAEGGVRETVIEGVNGIFAEHDEALFGAAVADLLGDPARLRALGHSARTHVEKHWPLGASIDRLERRLIAASVRHESQRAVSRDSAGSVVFDR
jgi:glycosyltransferase involved in cell wall biosynthesis